MFECIYKILDNAQRLNDREAFKEAIDTEVKELIIKLNTSEQLGKKGIDSEGDSLGEYAPFTVVERSSLGLQTDHIDFKVTGDYWKSWEVKESGGEILISVDSSVFNELVNDLKFSATHVGLTEENLAILADLILTRYLRYIKRRLFAQ